MAASALLKNTVSIEEWLAVATFVKLRNTVPWKNCSLQLNAVTYKEKHSFRNNYFGSYPFLMSCYFNKIFVHLPVIAAVYYFSVYKLIARRSGTMVLTLWEECERGQKKRKRDKKKLCNIKIVTLTIGTN